MQGQNRAEAGECKRRREQEEVERENDRKLKEAMERAQAEKRAEAEEHKKRRYGIHIRLHVCDVTSSLSWNDRCPFFLLSYF
jgi:hypothetical protein